MTLLTDRTIVVTGASRGIGHAAAVRLRDEGATVVRLARTLRSGWHEGFLDLPCDVTQEEDVDHAAQQVSGQLGVPDILVNNAGVFRLSPFGETTTEDFDAHLAANLRAPFLIARAFLPAMRRRGAGLLITVGSVSDHHAFPENSAYSASKFGVRGLHEVLREEYRGSGVRCSLISPGPVDTPMWDVVDLEGTPGLPPRSAMLRAEDVADAIHYLATRPSHVVIDWIRIGPA